MKTKNNLIFSLTLIFGLGFLVSCDPEEETKGADKTELLATIADAEALLADSEEGTSDGQYLMGSKAPLETAVTAAQAIADADASAQTAVDNANVNLTAAITTYEGKVITPIAVANLMAHWKFDEGTGTSASDASANNLDGTLKTGHPYWGAGVPAWAEDRYGNANSAIKFDKGAHVEVPYNTKLNPDAMTISLWMKQDVNTPILNNQYMVSLNRWNGYKLNMQDAPKAFMTVKADNGSAVSYYDRDNADPALAQGSWYHVVVTFGGGHMVFYVNGTLVKDWDNTPGTGVDLSANPINLTIGQDLPTATYTVTEGDFYVNWGGYFKGLLDEVRIYNTPLTETQVASLYAIEKPE